MTFIRLCVFIYLFKKMPGDVIEGSGGRAFSANPSRRGDGEKEEEGGGLECKNTLCKRHRQLKAFRARLYCVWIDIYVSERSDDSFHRRIRSAAESKRLVQLVKAKVHTPPLLFVKVVRGFALILERHPN